MRIQQEIVRQRSQSILTFVSLLKRVLYFFTTWLHRRPSVSQPTATHSTTMKKPSSSGALSGITINDYTVLFQFKLFKFFRRKWQHSVYRMHCCDVHVWRRTCTIPQPDTWANCHAEAIQGNLFTQKRKLQVRQFSTYPKNCVDIYSLFFFLSL